MCTVVASGAIFTDKTLFTLNISNNNVQTFAARTTREYSWYSLLVGLNFKRYINLHL